MAIKLIAMDLDGTLLNSDKTISPRNMAAIQAAKAMGVGVTIATGRMYMAAAYFGRLIGANVPLVCCNGGMVQSLKETEPLFIKCLDKDVVRELLVLCHERKWYAQWYIGQEIYAEKYQPEYFASYRTVENFHIKEVGDDFLSYTDQVIQCVVRDLRAGIPEVVEEIQQHFSTTIFPQQDTGFSVDLTPPGINKAVGLAALMKDMGLTPAEVMACGDADNDLAMLRFAGTSVVPANGQPEAKELASYLADENDADGIGRAIEELVLKR
jgi:Cof subfamily protein (haloacid dehalogenase superfamily)